MTETQRADIIIAGAGAAGLWSAYNLIQLGYKGKILLIDSQEKSGNDRTWSFWAKPEEEISNFASFSWDHISFETENVYKEYPIKPYRYYSVRSTTFYSFMKHFIEEQPFIEFIQDEIIEVLGNGTVICAKHTYQAEDYVLNSIYDPQEVKEGATTFLWQHFYGRVVEFDQPVFNENVMGFMNFAIPHEGDCRFLYTLPFSDRMALVEYTIFSEELLPFDAYPIKWDEAIKPYFKGDYWVLEEEHGKIPMTDYRFPFRFGKVLYIGTAGGQVKGSTGYGFKNMWEKSIDLAHSIIENRVPNKPSQGRNRYDWYDEIFLKVLNQHENPSELFEALFVKRNPIDVLNFLSGKGGIMNDLSIISACPKTPFLKAVFAK